MVLASAGFAACKKEERRNIIEEVDKRSVRKVLISEGTSGFR
jgi:hypothetical protein